MVWQKLKVFVSVSTKCPIFNESKRRIGNVPRHYFGKTLQVTVNQLHEVLIVYGLDSSGLPLDITLPNINFLNSYLMDSSVR
jgi:hypothetical protein